MDDGPFDSIESAHEFVNMLVQQVHEVEATLDEDFAASLANGHTRRLDALRLVHLKLHQLEEQLSRSSRILNDLKALRRLLLAEHPPSAPPAPPVDPSAPR